jgi:hypothetical protein
MDYSKFSVLVILTLLLFSSCNMYDSSGLKVEAGLVREASIELFEH